MESRSSQCLTPSQIEELLQNTVPAGQQAPDNAHLAVCERCREEFEEQRRFACLRGVRPLPTPPRGYDRDLPATRC